jgi:hypothetical protein
MFKGFSYALCAFLIASWFFLVMRITNLMSFERELLVMVTFTESKLLISQFRDMRGMIGLKIYVLDGFLF